MRRDLFEEAWGKTKRVDDIGQADVDRFVDLRRSGDLAPEGSSNEDGVRDPTIEADIRWLSTVFNWARGYKASARRLVPSNPLQGLSRPSKEKGVRRPIASHERFVKTLAKADEVGLAALTPLSEPARAALDAYLERNPRLGDVPLFPGPTDDSRPSRKDLAGDWLVRAEKLAKLPKLQGTRWHGYRRLFATELKALPIKDVAAAEAGAPWRRCSGSTSRPRRRGRWTPCSRWGGNG